VTPPFDTVAGAAAALRGGQTSARELLEGALARIDATDARVAACAQGVSGIGAKSASPGAGPITAS